VNNGGQINQVLPHFSLFVIGYRIEALPVFRHGNPRAFLNPLQGMIERLAE
jgi:hypothetical protein